MNDININFLNTENVGVFITNLNEYISDGMGFPKRALEYYKNTWNKEKITTDIINKKNLYLTAWSDNKLCGLLIGSHPEGGLATIIWVLVKKAMQKKGLGRILFINACDFYKKKGCHKIKLTVPDESTTIFYKKLGMSLEGTHLNHWWGMNFWSMGFLLKK